MKTPMLYIHIHPHSLRALTSVQAHTHGAAPAAAPAVHSNTLPILELFSFSAAFFSYAERSPHSGESAGESKTLPIY